MTALRIGARAGLGALVLVSGAALAEPGDSASLNGTATAELVNPGRLYKLEDLRFGAFMQPSANATLTITPDGAASGTGDIATGMNIPQPPEGRGPARFRLDGTANRAFVALIPNRITITNGSATMDVRDITTNIRPGNNRFDGAGRFDLHIGGTLRANAIQAPGQYSGDFQITVIFQ